MEVSPRVRHFSELVGHDVYELAYAHRYPGAHWSESSLYLEDEAWGIGFLTPYLNEKFPAFNYYGPEKIPLEQWDEIESAARLDRQNDPSVQAFFEQIRTWLQQGNRNADYFWILGI